MLLRWITLPLFLLGIVYVIFLPVFGFDWSPLMLRRRRDAREQTLALTPVGCAHAPNLKRSRHR